MTDCVACKKYINRRELAIGALSTRYLFNFKPFHKQCYKEFRCEGKHYDQVFEGSFFQIKGENKSARKFFSAYGCFYYKLGFYDLMRPSHWIWEFGLTIALLAYLTYRMDSFLSLYKPFVYIIILLPGSQLVSQIIAYRKYANYS